MNVSALLTCRYGRYPCEGARRWLSNYTNALQAWAECSSAEWMLWLFLRHQKHSRVQLAAYRCLCALAGTIESSWLRRRFERFVELRKLRRTAARDRQERVLADELYARVWSPHEPNARCKSLRREDRAVVRAIAAISHRGDGGGALWKEMSPLLQTETNNAIAVAVIRKTIPDPLKILASRGDQS